LVTHGPLPENDNYGGAQGEWTARTGSSANGNVNILDFLYEPGDLSMIDMTGVPTVKLGDTLNFNNVDGAAIYHTVTSCGFPCLGPTGTTFPIADGTTAPAARSTSIPASSGSARRRSARPRRPCSGACP